MGWLFVKRRMATELSQDWQKKFKEFDKEATRAASLGQVHKAFLNNDVVTLNLSAPGAAKLVNPLALSFKAGSISELIISSFKNSPIL